jgi:6-phosphogluconolactonase (cycloisomerase 2 family)
VVQNAVGRVFGLDGASALAVSGDGRNLFVTGREDAALAVFRRWATGDELAFVDLEQNGAGGVAGLGGASAVAVSTDGEQVYATGELDDALVVFARDATRDTLAFVEQHVDGSEPIDTLDAPTGLAVDPDGRYLYVTSAGDAALTVFERLPASDRLRFVEAHRDRVAGVRGLAGASAVSTDPTGRWVYVSGEASDSVVVFERNPRRPGLSFRDALYVRVGGFPVTAGADSLVVTPDGLDLLVTGLRGDTLAVFDVLQETDGS